MGLPFPEIKSGHRNSESYMTIPMRENMHCSDKESLLALVRLRKVESRTDVKFNFRGIEVNEIHASYESRRWNVLLYGNA